MNKLFKILILAAISLTATTSCLDDGDGAEATINYLGVCDSIVYTDSTNLRFDPFIKESVAEIFTESATTEESMAIYAEAKCNDQAVKTWQKKTSTFTISGIASKIFKEHSDTLSKHMGIQNAAELENDLKPMTLKTKLYSSRYQLYFYSLDKAIK